MTAGALLPAATTKQKGQIVSMKTVTGACDICKREFTNNNPTDLARAISTHQRLSHGAERKSTTIGSSVSSRDQLRRDKELAKYYEDKGITPKTRRGIEAVRRMSRIQSNILVPKTNRERNIRLKEQRKSWDRAYRARKAAQKNGQAATQFMPAMHDRCPKCGARFYYVADQQ
jgi:hypothetical protein